MERRPETRENHAAGMTESGIPAVSDPVVKGVFLEVHPLQCLAGNEGILDAVPSPYLLPVWNGFLRRKSKKN